MFFFQTCISANRIMVQSGIHDSFVAALQEAVSGLKMGDGLDEGVTIGPLINEPQINKVRHSNNLRHIFIPIVMREVYSFPHRQLILSFGGRLWAYISKSIPSVCTTISKRIAGLRFYPKFFMLFINGFVSTSSTNQWFFFFSNFELVFDFLAVNRNIFKWI